MQKNEPTLPTFTGPETPLEGMLAAVYSLELATRALADTFSLLHKVRNDADRSSLKKALRACIDHLEKLYKQIA